MTVAFLVCLGILWGWMFGFLTGSIGERRYWTARELLWIRSVCNFTVRNQPLMINEPPSFPPFPLNLVAVFRWVRGTPSAQDLDRDSEVTQAALIAARASIENQSPPTPGDEWKR